MLPKNKKKHSLKVSSISQLIEARNKAFAGGKNNQSTVASMNSEMAKKMKKMAHGKAEEVDEPNDSPQEDAAEEKPSVSIHVFHKTGSK